MQERAVCDLHDAAGACAGRVMGEGEHVKEWMLQVAHGELSACLCAIFVVWSTCTKCELDKDQPHICCVLREHQCYLQINVEQSLRHSSALLCWPSSDSICGEAAASNDSWLVQATFLCVTGAILTLCAAINHCHCLSIAHRDLKPENVLLALPHAAVPPDTSALSHTSASKCTCRAVL